MIVPGMVAYIYNPSTEEVEDYKLEASLDYIPRPCLKKKKLFPTQQNFESTFKVVALLMQSIANSSSVLCIDTWIQLFLWA
jgi:hypothetical protein